MPNRADIAAVPSTSRANAIRFAISSPAKAGEPSRTILIVEDEDAVRGVVSRFLAAKGFTVYSASHAKAAEPIWRKHREEIEILLADVVLPNGISGCKLASMLQGEKPELEVILTSGYNTEAAEFAAAMTPHTHFIPKPYRPDQLLDVMRGIAAAARN